MTEIFSHFDLIRFMVRAGWATEEEGDAWWDDPEMNMERMNEIFKQRESKHKKPNSAKAAAKKRKEGK